MQKPKKKEQEIMKIMERDNDMEFKGLYHNSIPAIYLKDMIYKRIVHDSVLCL
jgi:hypothetical protein